MWFELDTICDFIATIIGNSDVSIEDVLPLFNDNEFGVPMRLESSVEFIEPIEIELELFDSELSVEETIGSEELSVEEDGNQQEGIYPTYPYPGWLVLTSTAVVYGGAAFFWSMENNGGFSDK